MDSLSHPSAGVRPASVKVAQSLLTALGNPQERFPVIHVGGTNGKGSTCALLESALRHGGYATGLYTSPHLWRPGERIRLGGQPLSTESLVALIEQDVLPAARSLGIVPTEFEVFTAAGFLAFARAQIDVAVVEVGLGGRHDATNVVAPLASVITGIGLDHTDKLGDTVAAIAAAKAGIIKAGAPVITGATGAALAVVAAEAETVGVPCLAVGPALSLGFDHAGQRLRFRALGPGALDGDYALPLLGDHQLTNAALALQTLTTLQPQLPLAPADVRQGFAAVRWPGRMELVTALDERWLLDGAHNEEGAEALCRAIARHLPGHRVGLVFGAMADKPWAAMAARLAPLMSAVWLTPVPSDRTESVGALASVDWARQPISCTAYPQALFEAWQWQQRQAEPHIVLVAGSLSLVGACRAYLCLD